MDMFAESERNAFGPDGGIYADGRDAAAGQHIFAPNHDEALQLVGSATRYNAWLLDRIHPYLGERVLDFGAGIGTFTEMLASLSEFVMAVEPEPDFVARLERRFAAWQNVEVVEAEAETLRETVPRASFDAVVCLNVLEHIGEHERALAELRDCLRPGGHLLLLVPAHPVLYGSIDRLHGHERRYRKRDLRSLLLGTGFSVEVLRYVNPVGAVGWFFAARVLRRRHVSPTQLRLYESVVPVLRVIDRLDLPLGASLWAVARRPSTESGSAG
jgi:SAM-dependent methyltransferase